MQTLVSDQRWLQEAMPILFLIFSGKSVVYDCLNQIIGENLDQDQKVPH